MAFSKYDVFRLDGEMYIKSTIIMMEDVLVKLNPGLLWQNLRLTRRGLFLPAKWI
jgi:hypothetical protein